MPKKTLWADIDETTRQRWQAASRQARLKIADAYRKRQAERRRVGAGRRGVAVRCPIRTRDRLRALSSMHEGLASMRGITVAFVGWKHSAAEELRRIVDQEFDKTIEALEYLSATDARAAAVLAKGYRIAQHG